ncbi:hypothetical protein ACTVZO_44550 [Streptomyces sp. IBSNAI002]|uniref:hypothetical protein n=1 Tax=Streptomyces sp. IBSNAI002 TaxID=3457500 RepID=UPI003FD1C1CE
MHHGRPVHWMNPKEQFTIATEASGGADSDATSPFDVVFQDEGVSVVVSGYKPVVYDQSDSALECGHQRPLEVLRDWTETAEAAAQRSPNSPANREHAEYLRRMLTEAEATRDSSG